MPEDSLDQQISELRQQLAAAAEGSAEQCDVRLGLAAALLARYESRDDATETDPAPDLDEVIDELDGLLAVLPAAVDDRADALFLSALARYYRCPAGQDPADLDVAITQLHILADWLPDGDVDGAALEALTLLGDALASRYRLASADASATAARNADLDAAIGLHERVLRQWPDGQPGKVAWAQDLGELYYDRLDIESAIECFRWVAETVLDGDPVQGEANARLGVILAERALRPLASPADAGAAITALTSAQRWLEVADPRQPVIAIYLAVMLGARFMAYGGGLDDRIRAIAALREAIASDDADLPAELMDLARVWLAQLLLMRVLPTRLSGGGAFDLAAAARLTDTLLTDEARAEADEAVRQLSLVTGAATDDDTAVAVAVLLGSALLARGIQHLPVADLDRIIECFALASSRVPLSTDGGPELAAVHGWALAERANLPDHSADLSVAADRLRQASEHLPPGHPLRPLTLHYLGVMLDRRGIRESRPADLTAGIDALTAALELMAPGHPMRTETAAMLAAAMLSGVQFDLSAMPLDKVLGLAGEASADSTLEPGKRAVYLCCYGQAQHLRAVRDRRYEEFATAADTVKQAAELIPKDQRIYPYALFVLGSMLADQYSYTGNLEALDAAVFYLDGLVEALTAAGGPAFDPDRVDLCSARAVRGSTQMVLAQRNEELALFESAIADLEFAVQNYPAQYPMRARVASDLGVARLGAAVLRKDMAALLGSWPGILAPAEGLPAGHPDRGGLRGRAGLISVAQAWFTQDPALLDRGIGLLQDAATDPGLALGEQARLMWGLGHGFVHRYDLSQRQADIDAGIDWLEKARDALRAEPGSTAAAHVLAALAGAYWTRASRGEGAPHREDLRAAVGTGLAALREQAGDVLLQTGTGRALAMARLAAIDAQEVAGWSLADGDPDRALQALEFGRGLVLHAATAVHNLPGLLASTGHPELAEEWATASRAGSDQVAAAPWDRAPATAEQTGRDRAQRGLDDMISQLPEAVSPSDLRHRVLIALAGSAAEQTLFAPPGLDEITKAMRATATDAVAYLLPGTETGTGRAVLLGPEHPVEVIDLPGLDASLPGPVGAYAAALQQTLDRSVAADEQAATEATARWRQALTDLCAWAWPAADPLLRRLAERYPGRSPRLTVIPFGLLGMVPWHAAHGHDALGREWYACEQAVFSYAVSARELVAAVRGDVVPAATTPTVVADPVGSNPWTSLEARYVHSVYYPDGAYLTASPPDEATPERVLRALPDVGSPGASLLHLSCHAQTGVTSASSRLLLSGQRDLTVERILRQAERRDRDRPGGLVVLSACVSDLSPRDYDEALTLTAAFMAAGAASVVGARWQVPDVRTALLMFMFHHYLAAGQSPASALCSAQLWMLGPEHPIPREMPSMLAEEVPLSDLGEVAAWAGFIHQGR